MDTDERRDEHGKARDNDGEVKSVPVLREICPASVETYFYNHFINEKNRAGVIDGGENRTVVGFDVRKAAEENDHRVQQNDGDDDRFSY